MPFRIRVSSSTGVLVCVVVGTSIVFVVAVAAVMIATIVVLLAVVGKIAARWVMLCWRREAEWR